MDDEHTRYPRTGFMDLTAFDYELGHAPRSEVYASVEDLHENHDCVDECGIVEVEVRFVRMVQEPRGCFSADPEERRKAREERSQRRLMERFQGQPWYIKLGRVLWWYPRVPWWWLKMMRQRDHLGWRTEWNTAVGCAQIEMNWVYDWSEVRKRTKGRVFKGRRARRQHPDESS